METFSACAPALNRASANHRACGLWNKFLQAWVRATWPYRCDFVHHEDYKGIGELNPGLPGPFGDAQDKLRVVCREYSTTLVLDDDFHPAVLLAATLTVVAGHGRTGTETLR